MRITPTDNSFSISPRVESPGSRVITIQSNHYVVATRKLRDEDYLLLINISTGKLFARPTPITPGDAYTIMRGEQETMMIIIRGIAQDATVYIPPPDPSVQPGDTGTSGGTGTAVELNSEDNYVENHIGNEFTTGDIQVVV